MKKLNRSWIDLPDDVLELIFTKLGGASVSNLIRSSLVCKSWQSVAVRRIKHGHSVPLLLVPSKEEGCRRALFSVQHNKVIDHISVPHAKRFCGSCFGWLITNSRSGLTLYNPFSRTTIVFPTLTETLVAGADEDFYDRIDADDPTFFRRGLTDNQVLKAALSRDPELYPDDFVLAVIYGGSGRAAFIMPGDEDWTYLPNRFGIDFLADVLYYDDKFYFVRYNCQLVVCDFEQFSPFFKRIIPAFDYPFDGKPYLVELPNGGGLYLLLRISDSDRKTKEFHVFKFEMHNGKAKWVLSFDMGGAAIFLGDNCSISIMAAGIDGCKSNCIYFADDYSQCIGCVHLFICNLPRHKVEPPKQDDNGIYDVPNKIMGQHYQFNPTRDMLLPPVWISLKSK